MVVFSLLGGLVATYFDWFNFSTFIDERFIFGIYTIIVSSISVPGVYFWNLIILVFTNAIDDWRNVDIFPWNPYANQIGLGLEIINNKDLNIDECEIRWFETLIPIEDEIYVSNFIVNQYLPSTLAWVENNNPVFKRKTINRNQKEKCIFVYKYEGMYNQTENKKIENIWEVKGKHYSYSGIGRGYYVIGIEISGKINNEPLSPKRVWPKITINNRARVKEILYQRPKIRETIFDS